MKKSLSLIFAVIVLAVASAQLETIPDWLAGLAKTYPYLHKTFLRVGAWQWIGLGILLAVACLMAFVVCWVAIRLTRFRDHFAAEPMADPTRFAIGRSSGILIGALFATLLLDDIALGLRLGLKFTEHLEKLLNLAALLGGVLLVYAAWDVACDTLASRSVGHERAERLLVPMTRKLVRAGVVVCGILATVALLGGTETITTLIGTLGIGGLVVALAGKDSIENLFGSFTILFDMPFALGDWIKTNGVEGTVEQINLRSTMLRTAEDTVVHLPNANLIRASVENFGSRRFRRMKLTVRLSFDCRSQDIDTYIAALRKYLSKQKEITPEKTEVVLTDPNETSIGLLIDCRLEVETYAQELAARHRVLEEALRLRHEHHIEFAAAPRPADPAVQTDATAQSNLKAAPSEPKPT